MSKTNTNFGLSIGVVVVVAVLAVAILKLVESGLGGGGSAEMTADAIEERIAPVGKLNTGEPKMAGGAEQGQAAAGGEAEQTEQVAEAETGGGEPAGDGGGRSGEEVYNATCVACHGTGASGAPKIGDTEAWAPRIEKGMDTLMDSAMNGVAGTAMLPKGTCNDCSEAEMRKAVEYMVEKSS